MLYPPKVRVSLHVQTTAHVPPDPLELHVARRAAAVPQPDRVVLALQLEPAALHILVVGRQRRGGAVGGLGRLPVEGRLPLPARRLPHEGQDKGARAQSGRRVVGARQQVRAVQATNSEHRLLARLRVGALLQLRARRAHRGDR